MLFPDVDLARRVECAERDLSLEVAQVVSRRRPEAFATPLGGGAAVFTGLGAPVNKIIGLGLDGPLDEAALATVEREFVRRGSQVQVELCALADPSVGEMLTRRGYLLAGFEHVLGLVLQPGAWPARQPDPALQVTHATPGQTGEFLRLVTTGFSQPDGTGTASHETFSDEALLQVFEDFAEAPSMRRYMARWDGTPAGGGTMRLGGSGVAQLAGASTLPRFRRRGVQSALLHARLTDALREGYDLAVVTTQPGSKSQGNAHRHGFSLLYARAVLVRR